MAQLTVFDRDSYPSEQFEDAPQQIEAATIGMWAFLATEVLFFGVMFVAFYVYRIRWPEDFAIAAHDLKLFLGTTNTGVLLISSYFVAMAVHAVKEGNHRALHWYLILTIVLGLVFLGIKFTEYTLEYHDKLVPQLNFSTIAPDGQHRPIQTELFMTFYFVMTGFHALHMIIGVGVMTTLAVMNHRGVFKNGYYTPVEIGGLYWHFVDIVWVFLFPTLYLLRHL